MTALLAAPAEISTAPVGRIDIALGFDGGYAPHAAAVIASVVRHAPGGRFRFIIVHAAMDAALKAGVEAVAPGSDFVWTEVRDADVPAWEGYGHFNRSVLFRLGLESLAPADCRRVLYLDSDTIVMHDVRELWASDLAGQPVGAVHDQYNVPSEFAALWSLPPDVNRYFNSGVMIIDLDAVRREKLFSRTLDFFVPNHKKMPSADQDALNYIFWGRWTPLDPAWNVQRFMTPKEFAAETRPERQVRGGAPALVHYIGLEKPWLPDKWHPWAWAYWQNLSRTPFRRDVARKNHMDLIQMTKLWLRWLLKRPARRIAR